MKTRVFLDSKVARAYVNTSFSTPGKVKRIMNHRWKKNLVPLMLVGHPTVKYVGTISISYPLQAMNSVRKALSIGGPTYAVIERICVR
jgi:pyruvate ferredoxin oxidoreductase beta subunit